MYKRQVEGRPVNVDTSEDWVKYGIDPSKDSTDESLLAKELDIPLYPGGVYRPLPTKELPVSIKKAQDIGSIFYKGSDGKKKLALYKSQLETFKESLSYEEGEGSALSQARKWMELQQGAGDAIDFDNLGGGPKQILNKEWDTVIDVTLPDADAAIVEDAMGDWTVAHDLGSRAKRAWEEGIRPTGDVQAEWDRIIAEQPERTAEVLQAELDAIEKERLALDAELGEFPAQYPPIDELVTQPETVVPREYADAVLPKDMAPIQDTTPVEKESILDKVYDWGGAFNLPSAKDIVDWATTPEVVAQEDAFAKEQKAQQLANEYRDIHQEVLSDFPANRGVNASGTNLAYRKAPTWEELYPLAPQGDSYPDEINTRISGLWPDQWIDPHPLANNIELGAYYRIPVEDRHKIYKPPESRWDASKSAGSVWDRERRADIEGRGMVDEFVKIQEQAEKDALDKAALDEWWAQARAETYQDDLPEFDVPVLEDGQPAGMQEGVYGIPDPLQGDVLNQRWMGLDEVAPYDAGYFEDAVVPEEYWLDTPDETPFLPHFDDRSGYGVGGDIQEFMYNGERWYLTEQGFYAKDYKRSELVTPHQSLPPDFF